MSGRLHHQCLRYRDDARVTSTLVLRQPLALRIVSVVALTGLAFVLASAGLTSGAALAWLGPLAATATAALAVRTWRLRVAVTTDGLMIANTFRTRTIRWLEIDRIVYDGGVHVRLRSGREITVSAFAHVTGSLPAVSRRNARAAKRLQAAVKHHRRH